MGGTLSVTSLVKLSSAARDADAGGTRDADARVEPTESAQLTTAYSPGACSLRSLLTILTASEHGS